jgi:uncharacterized protein YejL (UPF0352 family)
MCHFAQLPNLLNILEKRARYTVLTLIVLQNLVGPALEAVALVMTISAHTVARMHTLQLSA